MKKFLGSVLAFTLMGASLFAYNPPAGGQNVLRLTSPWLITGANSAAGGALFGITPASIINNPALTAWEQRNTLDLGATFFINSNTDNPFEGTTHENESFEGNKIGEAFQAALLIPSRWCVSTFLFQGVWTKAFDMPIGDSVNATAGFSKDITDQVSVGMTANFGYLYGDTVKADWTASAAFGAYYNHGDISFMKNVRFGASLSNLGKMYSKEALGIKSAKAIRDNEPENIEDASMWPGIATLRTGVAATMLETDIMNLGLSLDFAFPAFQNFVTDLGLQLQFWDMIKVYSSWEFDVREFANDSKNLLPSIGVSFRFRFTQNGAYMSKHGWEESDMTVSGAWKQMYKNVNAVSAGAILNLGLTDTKAPEITLWGEDK